MAVQLEFYNFIVPRTTIEEKYPGGWKQCLDDHRHLVGGRVWYDDHLFRDGAMNVMDIETLITRWESYGFQALESVNGEEVRWIDLCVVEGMFGGSRLPCDWIMVDENGGYLKNEPPGRMIGRDDFDPPPTL